MYEDYKEKKEFFLGDPFEVDEFALQKTLEEVLAVIKNCDQTKQKHVFKFEFKRWKSLKNYSEIPKLLDRLRMLRAMNSLHLVSECNQLIDAEFNRVEKIQSKFKDEHGEITKEFEKNLNQILYYILIIHGEIYQKEQRYDVAAF